MDAGFDTEPSVEGLLAQDIDRVEDRTSVARSIPVRDSKPSALESEECRERAAGSMVSVGSWLECAGALLKL